MGNPPSPRPEPRPIAGGETAAEPLAANEPARAREQALEARIAELERELDALRSSPARAGDERLLIERTAIAESIPDGVALIDPAGRAFYQNRAFRELLGSESLEEVSLPLARLEALWEVTDLDGRPVPIEAWPRSRALRGETFTEYELRVRRRDGSRDFIASHRGSLVRSPAGDPLFALLVVHDITAGKRAEEALRTSEVRYRTLVEVTGAVTWSCPPSGLHVAPQAAWMAFTGQAAEDMLGAGWTAAVHPDDAAAAAQRWRDAVARGEPFVSEHRVRRHDGEWRCMSVHAAPVHGGRGEVLEWVGMNLDITERKQAEELARERLAELEDLYRNAPVGLCLLDCDLRFVRINERMAAINGVPAAAHLGKTLRELMPALADAAEASLRAVLQSGQPRLDVEVVSETPARPGVQRSRLEQWLPVKDAQDRVTGISIVVEEITERKRSEAQRERLLGEVQVERDRIAALVASMQDEVWFADTQQRFTLANPAALKEFGLAMDGAVDIEELVAGLEVLRPDGSPRPLEESPPLRALNGEVVTDEEEIIRTPARGELRYRQVNATPVRDKAGVIIGAVAVVRDITERKMLEDALREASRRKDEFLAMLAHELRNPLAPIRTGLDLLQALRCDAAACEQPLQIMDRQLTHLVRLVDDLLDVSRISRGKMELHKERLDLAEIISAAVEMGESGIGRQLTVSVPPEPVLVEGDRVRLVQVVSNLLNNAAKFTDGGGHIALRVERQGDRVEVQVQDDGRGIPRERLADIFELFAQAAPGRDGGLGIGLTLVRSLVELHGGTVSAASDGPGRGATFTVSLPLCRDVPEQPTRANARATEPLPGRRVLVVDDNRDIADGLRLLLKTLGAEVQVAYNGAEAVRLCADWQPTHVLMDLGMPIMDGYEAARRLCANHPDRAFRLVAISGWGKDEDRQRAREAGFDQHLTKPVGVADLKVILSG